MCSAKGLTYYKCVNRRYNKKCSLFTENLDYILDVRKLISEEDISVTARESKTFHPRIAIQFVLLKIKDYR